MQRLERVVHGKELSADFVCVLREACARHHPGCCSTGQSRSHVIVSIVTRSVYGDEQFSSMNRARINRDAGHPGQGVEARGSRDTQSFSQLSHGPPHCVSPELAFTLKLGLSKALDFAAEIRRYFMACFFANPRRRKMARAFSRSSNSNVRSRKI